ncbi:DUF2971 domain-containing protein [Dyadobacter sp. CY261]|uniref:DUF2971 domain-containing protein n=1 Tax=Dyadobacter sp. CY261 TaxID=2907203 RepID=UPI001F24D846|nr:DUF2971 domain-containing protein [Dyadobacter sp. CY261]MCF0075299.1 DUF2971 domain-containing protein [Dyadobacter sp. CY261]
MILYKYRGKSGNTDKIFTERKVWLSNAAGLNDPFECSIQEIAKEWIDEHVRELKQGHLSGLIFAFMQAKKSNSHFFGLSVSDAEKLISSFKTIPSFDDKYKFYREFMKSRNGKYPSDPEATFAGFDQQLNDAGIFSLSENAENQLMWSHYADDTRGIAIGFKVEPNSKLSDDNCCVKVNYSDMLPSFAGKGFLNEISFYMDEYGRPYSKQKVSFSDPTFRLAISTKPTVWSYEREWRYIEEQSGAYPLPVKLAK